MPIDDPMIPDHDSRRRSVLRGVLATGCALGVPGLWGCKQKPPPAEPETGAAAPESGMPPPPEMPSSTAEPSSPETSPASDGKMSKEAAQYQEQPKGDQQCSNCMQFLADSNTCKLVEGSISPEGWCILWVKKEA